MRRYAVYVHGYHRAAANWTEVCWGRPPHELGRGPAALAAAVEFDAPALIFGLGGAKADHVRWAPDAIHAELCARVDELAAFEAFTPEALASAREVLARRVRFAPDSNASTRGELDGLVGAVEDLHCDGVVLVSSPDHAPRCLRDALSAFRGSGIRRTMVWCSDVPFSEAAPVIVEKPHRPDRDAIDLHAAVARMLEAPAEARARAADAAVAALEAEAFDAA